MLDKTFEREPALQPLSRDHGVLLVLVQRLHKAAEATVQDRIFLINEMRTRLAMLVEQYLADEDDTLSLMTFSDFVRDEIARQHREIKQAIKSLAACPIGRLKSVDFNALANLIEDHIRWDERTVIPYLQSELDDRERSELALHTAEIESQRSRPIQRLHRSINLDKGAGKAQTCTCADSL